MIVDPLRYVEGAGFGGPGGVSNNLTYVLSEYIRKAQAGIYWDEYWANSLAGQTISGGTGVYLYGADPLVEYQMALDWYGLNGISLEAFVNMMGPIWEYANSQRSVVNEAKAFLSLMGIISVACLGILAVGAIIETAIGLAAAGSQLYSLLVEGYSSSSVIGINSFWGYMNHCWYTAQAVGTQGVTQGTEQAVYFGKISPVYGQSYSEIARRSGYIWFAVPDYMWTPEANLMFILQQRLAGRAFVFQNNLTGFTLEEFRYARLLGYTFTYDALRDVWTGIVR